MSGLDPRLNAMRPDLADVALRGRVDAAHFVAPVAMRVVAPMAPLRRAPAADAPRETEALFGEDVALFEARDDGWCWVQLTADRYVGWLRREALGEPGAAATHRVCVTSTFVFARADIKSEPLAVLPLGARIAVTGESEDRNARYALLASGGAIVMQHLAAPDAVAPDWTATAERFLGVPYLWGGKTSAGIDCSGLVQVALAAAGIAAPRDTDMQAGALGDSLALDAGLPPLARGDLVFWPGHVGLMRDGATLLHANAHAMLVTAEPLAAAVARSAARGVAVSAVRRIAAGGR